MRFKHCSRDEIEVLRYIIYPNVNSQFPNKKKPPGHASAITRREFVGRTLAAGAIIGAPAFLRGQNLNNKLNIAFIACGGRANTSLGELTVVPGRSAGGSGRRAGAAT